MVGVGSLGFHHARLLSELAGVSLSGFFDLDRKRAATVAEALGSCPFETLDRLVRVSDGIVVAVPTGAHEEVATVALRRGVPVLLEKPVTASLKALDRMFELCTPDGPFLQPGFVERFNPVFVAARQSVQGALFIEAQRLAPFSTRGSDVDVVLDLMIHDVDLVTALVGRAVTEIAAVGVAVLTDHVDIANARLTFEGGAVANLTASRVSTNRTRKLRIFQRSGYLSLDLDRSQGSMVHLGDLDGAGASSASWPPGLPATRPIEVVSYEPLEAELASFRDAVAGVSRPAVAEAEARTALAVTLAIRRRIEEHVVDTGSP